MPIYCTLSNFNSIAQCDLGRYFELIQEGDGCLKNDNPNYQGAMSAYSAAMIACKDKMPEVQQKIIGLFNEINNLKLKAEIAEKKAIAAKKKADSARISADEQKVIAEKEKMNAENAMQNANIEKARADAALQIAENIISQLYFYNDRFALAVKKEPFRNNNLYGFIDKQGNTVIDFRFNEALPFDENTGLARVGDNEGHYFIDTQGNKYILTEEVDSLNYLSNALDLRYKKLNEFPQKALKFDQLKIILLSNNYIKQLPADLSAFSKSLIYLDLSYNRFTSFPKEIRNLRNLKKLNLTKNNLPEIPSEIGNLYRLNYLKLSSDTIESIPAEIGNLTELIYLDLSFNRISYVPPEIGNLVNLTSFNLQCNQLEELPVEIGNLKNIEELNLKLNKLDEVPSEICNLLDLTFLDLSFNNLMSLPTDISNLKNLTHLYLSSNNFSEEEMQRVQLLLPNCKILW